MELETVLNQRRSIRKYEERSVLHEDVVACIQAANLAPSWKNSQVTRYYVIESQEMIKRVRGALAPFNQENCLNAPVLIVSTIILNRYGFTREGVAENELGNGWGYYDCGLQSMNLLLKATELGLGSLVMGIRDADVLRDILDIPNQESIVSVIALGYANEEVEMPRRKDVLDLAHFY